MNKRRELYFAAQKMLYDQGGYIVWGFVNLLDGVSKKSSMVLTHTQGETLGFITLDDIHLFLSDWCRPLAFSRNELVACCERVYDRRSRDLHE